MAQNPDVLTPVDPESIPEHLRKALAGIKAIALDIDGVLTRGELIPLRDGDILRIMDAKDSFGVRVAAQKGYLVTIISGGDTEALRRRCLHLGCKPENLYLGTRGKLSAFKDFCKRNGLSESEVMYFGDDIPDTQVLKTAGVGVAPADAAFEAREAADIVSVYPGGHWCVRDAVETMMRIQGTWKFDPSKYDQIY